MVMNMVNIADAKARLSEYLELASGGQDVVICRHNRPVAKLVAVEPGLKARTEPRPVGGASGAFVVPDSFFEPLSPAIEAMFYPGLEGNDPITKVAEKSGA
jgi:prevent-host-death family protein